MKSRLIHILVFTIFFTSSFDIYFNLNLFGFNVRTCYFASILFACISAFSHVNSLKFRFIGFLSISIWIAIAILFVGHTQLLNRNIGYVFWMLFNLIMCYSIYKFTFMVEYNKIIQYYIISFFLIAAFGIVQFAFGAFGLHFFITMWWKLNQIPRVNGLSYEPSYFATYLLIGFVFLYFSWRKKIYYFSERLQLTILISIILAIFLSTSRMGILFMISIMVIDFWAMILRAFITHKISKTNLLVSASLLVLLFGTIGYILSEEKLKKRYLAGTGLASTANHSKNTRITQMTNVWDVFLASPIYGYSLGGIAPAIALYHGVKAPDLKKAKEFEGLNIFLEVLAATGIVGFIFFSYWLFLHLYAPRKLAGILKANGFEKESGILICLGLALAAELLILVLSQNILRPYLWILIGVTNGLYFRFKDMIFVPDTNPQTQNI